MAWLAQRVDARTAGMYTLMALGDKLPLHALSQAFPAASPGNEDSSSLHFWPNYHLRSPQVRTVIYLAPSRAKTCLFMDRQICALFNGPVCFLRFYLAPFGQIGRNHAYKSNNPRQVAEFHRVTSKNRCFKTQISAMEPRDQFRSQVASSVSSSRHGECDIIRELANCISFRKVFFLFLTKLLILLTTCTLGSLPLPRITLQTHSSGVSLPSRWVYKGDKPFPFLSTTN